MGANDCKRCTNDQGNDNDNESIQTNQIDFKPKVGNMIGYSLENNPIPGKVNNTKGNNSFDSKEQKISQKKTSDDNEKKEEEEDELIILLPNEEERKAKFGIFKPNTKSINFSQSQFSIPEEEDDPPYYYPPSQNNNNNKSKTNNNFYNNNKPSPPISIASNSLKNLFKNTQCYNNKTNKLKSFDAKSLSNYKFKKVVTDKNSYNGSTSMMRSKNNIFENSFHSEFSIKNTNIAFRIYKHKNLNKAKVSSNLKSQNFYQNIVKKDLLFAIECTKVDHRSDIVNNIFVVVNVEGICIYRSKENYLYNKLPIIIIGFDFIKNCTMIDIDKNFLKKLKKISKYNFLVEMDKEKIFTINKNSLDPMAYSMYKKYFSTNTEFVFMSSKSEEDANNFVYLVNKMKNANITDLCGK